MLARQPSSKTNPFHHMLANSLAQAVAEEAAKRLLPDMNMEQKAKKEERIGVSVANRLAPVQAEIWAKHGEVGDIYELDPLLEEEEVNTLSSIEKLVEELAHQGHLLVRHQEGLKCQACTVYRADRQFKFWSRKLCVPRPRAADVISRLRNKKRQYISAWKDKLVSSKTACFYVYLPVTSISTRLSEFSGLAEAKLARPPGPQDIWDDRVTNRGLIPVLLSAECAETFL